MQLPQHHFRQFQSGYYFFRSGLTVGFVKFLFRLARLTFLKTMNEVARFKAHNLKDFLIVSGLISSHACRIQFTIVRRGGGYKFPAEINWLIPSSANYWSYFFVARALKGLFQLTPGACTYFVHPPWTIETNIFFAWSDVFTVSLIWHSYEPLTR